MRLATQMKNALDAVTDPGCEASRGGICRCCDARTEPANAGLEGVTDELLARMDWAAGLTDEQMCVLRLAVELVDMTETVHKHERDRQAFYWLRQGLEALP